jgi:hypothetical protein
MKLRLFTIDDDHPRRLLTRAEFDRMLELCRDPEYVASQPCACGMVEVDNPVRREVRHRRGCPREDRR